jgi:hypothetical protein
MSGRLTENKERIIRLGLAKYYVCFWPKDNISEEYYNTNYSEFAQTRDTFTKALASATQIGLISKNKSIELDKTNKESDTETSSPSVTPTPSPIPPEVGQTCPPPVVSTFSPAAGYTGTIVQVNGRNFESVKSVRVINKDVELKDITVFNSETLIFNLPNIEIPEGQDVATGRISVTTEYGTFESLFDFTFNPALQNKAVSSAGGFGNPSVQQQPTLSQQNNFGSDINPQNIGGVTLIGSYEGFGDRETNFGEPFTYELTVSVDPNFAQGTIQSDVVMSVSVYDIITKNNVRTRELAGGTTDIISGDVVDNKLIITFSQISDLLINDPIPYFKENPTRNDQSILIQFVVKAIPDDSNKFPKPVDRPFTWYYR